MSAICRSASMASLPRNIYQMWTKGGRLIFPLKKKAGVNQKSSNNGSVKRQYGIKPCCVAAPARRGGGAGEAATVRPGGAERERRPGGSSKKGGENRRIK